MSGSAATASRRRYATAPGTGLTRPLDHKQRGVLGVYAAPCDTAMPPDSFLEPGTRDVLTPDAVQLLQTHSLVYVNGVGEGQMNVCGRGGNLEVGDLLVSSSMPGKAERQSDDLVRSCTVAKVREPVIFTDPDEVKLVACIYMCG